MMHWRLGIGGVVALSLTACSVAPGPVARPARDFAPGWAVAMARQHSAAWRAATVTRVAVAMPSASRAAPSSPPRPAPATRAPSAPSPASPSTRPESAVAMVTVPQYDPPAANEEFTGFLVTLDLTNDTATIGPGWWLNPQTDQFVEIYPGGTVALPASLSSTGLTAPYWPAIVMQAWDNGQPAWWPNPVTSATVSLIYPSQCATSCATGVSGTGPVINREQTPTATLALVTLGVTYGAAPQTTDTFSQGTWVTFDLTVPGTTWSGGSFGVGTPTYTPPSG